MTIKHSTIKAEPLRGSITKTLVHTSRAVWCPSCGGPTTIYATTGRYNAARCNDEACGFTWEVWAE